MNRRQYLSRAAAGVPRHQRGLAREAAEAELDDLMDELVADGRTRADAEREALEILVGALDAAWSPWSVRAVVRAPWAPATWRSAAFLVLLFPLGIAYGIWATAGAGIVAGLSVLIIGLFLVVPWVLALRPLAQSVGALASWATGQPMPMLRTVPRDAGHLMDRIKARLTDPESLAAWLICILAFAMGQIAIAWLAGLGSAIVFLAGSPVFTSLPVMPGDGSIYPEVLLASAAAKVAVGVALFWLWSWGNQALAWAFARITRGVLTRS